MKFFTNINLIKIIIIYWIVLIIVQIFFGTFTEFGAREQITDTSFKLPKVYKWDLLFNFVILIPAFFVVIFKIIGWKKR